MAAVPASAPLLDESQKAEAVPSELGPVRHRAGALVSGIVLSCVVVITAARLCSVEYPLVFSHALIAFGLGLRHAVDCDHLAAIDNVTRQLMNQGQRPVSVGFWFAAGHSTVVVLMTAVLAGGYSWAWHVFGEGSTVAEGVELGAAIISIGILGVIGCLNAHIAMGLFRDWVGVRRLASKEAQDAQLKEVADASLRTALQSIPGVKRLFERVSRPLNMYPVGFLFGLSFDSATQVGLIGLAAMTGTSGRIPPLMVMIFPTAFSCGMCFVDTCNGLLMLATYSWTNLAPIQKLFYNFVVTALSAGIALVICSLEILQIVAQQFDLHGPAWDFIQGVDMATVGYSIILTFALIFTAAVLYSHGAGGRCCRCKDKGTSRQPHVLSDASEVASSGP